MERTSWRRWIPALLWMGVIFYFSQRPNVETGLSCDFTLKKAAHLFEYGLLAAAFYVALHTLRGRFDALTARKAWALSTLYAVTDEFHQAFVPTRTAHPRDVVIDSLGAAALLCLLWLVQRKDKPSRK